MITFDVLSIFPDILKPFLNESILKRAQEKRKVLFRVHDLRAYTTQKQGKVDDRPFGGGPGMVMTPQPIFDAVKAVKGRRKARVILTCAGGRPLTQATARRLAKERNIILICGHYEGVDERVRTGLADESLSIGDYVLTGGELPALVIIDAVTRLIPGVLGKEASLAEESHENNLLEYPHYTRPADFLGMKVPEILLSGHHKEIAAWRREQALKRTREIRPDWQ